MNGWILAATVLLAAGGGAALWGVATGPLSRRVIAQNLSTTAVCPSLLLLAPPCSSGARRCGRR